MFFIPSKQKAIYFKSLQETAGSWVNFVVLMLTEAGSDLKCNSFFQKRHQNQVSHTNA